MSHECYLIQVCSGRPIIREIRKAEWDQTFKANMSKLMRDHLKITSEKRTEGIVQW